MRFCSSGRYPVFQLIIQRIDHFDRRDPMALRLPHLHNRFPCVAPVGFHRHPSHGAGRQYPSLTPGQDFSKFRTRRSWKENMIAPSALPEEREEVEKKSWILSPGNSRKKATQKDSQNPDFYIEIRAASMPTRLTTSANLARRVPEGSDVFSPTYPEIRPGVNILLTMTAGARSVTVTDSTSTRRRGKHWYPRNTKTWTRRKGNLDKELDPHVHESVQELPGQESQIIKIRFVGILRQSRYGRMSGFRLIGRVSRDCLKTAGEDLATVVLVPTLEACA